MKLSKLPIPQTPNIQMPINIYILFKQWSPEGWQVIRFYISVENGLGSHVCSSVATLRGKILGVAVLYYLDVLLNHIQMVMDPCNISQIIRCN